MKAEIKHKEQQQAASIQSKRERSKLSFADNRSQTVNQRRLIESIQNRENKTLISNNSKKGPGQQLLQMQGGNENEGLENRTTIDKINNTQRKVIQLGKSYTGGKSTGRGGKGKKYLAPSKKVIKRLPPKMLFYSPPKRRQDFDIMLFRQRVAPYINILKRVLGMSKDVLVHKKSRSQFSEVVAFFKSPDIAYASDFLFQFALSYKDKLPHSIKVFPLPLDDVNAGYYRRETSENKSELVIHVSEEMDREDIASTLIHEYTHVFDLEVLESKDYRKVALDCLKSVLEEQGMYIKKANVGIYRFRQICGLLDSHSDTTVGLSNFLSELLASFSGLAILKNPMSKISSFSSVYKTKLENDEDYSGRIIRDYDTIMRVLKPYITSIINDKTLPIGIRNYFAHSLTMLPITGVDYFRKLIEYNKLKAILLILQSLLLNQDVEEEDVEEEDVEEEDVEEEDVEEEDVEEEDVESI